MANFETQFDFFVQDADTLAAAIYGIIEETEDNMLQYIYMSTGITIDKVTPAPEIRIESIKQDLLRPYVPSEAEDDTT